jgi:hypothetical protein
MDRCQIESAERGDHQNHQRSQRRVRDAGRYRRVDDENQADCAERGMDQR